jgi:molecular chaperone GrpE
MEAKKIDIKEFRESGYLQEVNRRFFHPLGLAIEVTKDDLGDFISGIWDYREETEGIYYDINNSSDEERKSKFKLNKEFIDNQFKIKLSNRKSKLGFGIEPVPGSLEIPADDFLSLAAEFDNYKKRTLREKEEAITNTKVKMLTSLIDMDNDISIALKNTQDEGIKLIASKLSNFLKSNGIEEIQTETYDEDLHEVISILPGEENKIVDVVTKGYVINGKPFRYPKIIISKNNSNE